MTYQNIYSVLTKGPFKREAINVIWNKESISPPLEFLQNIKNYWQEIKTPYIFDGQLARLTSFSVKKKELTLSLCPGNYSTLLYSNSHVETILANWGEKNLSRILGISAVLETFDNNIVLMKRSSHVGEFPNCYDVFGGHIDVPTDNTKPDVFTSMEQELREEVGLTPQNYQLELIALIEANVNRKPELVFVAKSLISFESIKEKASTAKDKGEWDKIIAIPKSELGLFLNEKKKQISPSAYGSIDIYSMMLRG